MATRLRKTRRLRGGRHMGWGQVAQHRASGHKGGLGVTGFQKHHYSSLLKDEPDHYGNESSKPPHPNITKKWASVRDLDDLFSKFGKEEGGKSNGKYSVKKYARAGLETSFEINAMDTSGNTQ